MQIEEKDKSERKLRESQETLNEAQKIAHLGSWSRDIKSGRNEWSDEQFRIYGLEPNSIIPTFDTFLAAVHPEDKDQVLQAIEHTLNGTRSFNQEFRIIRPDGDIRFVHVQGNAYRSADGKPEKTIGTTLDITERKRIEQALSESVEQVRSMFTYSDSVVALSALDGSILRANPALRKMLGYTYEELKQLSFFDITHPDDRADTVEKRTSLINGEIKSFHLEKRYVSKDGKTVWIRGSANLIRDAEGKPRYVLDQFQDITKRKQAEDALAESEARLQAIMDHSPAAILLKDTDGRYIVFNRSFEQRSGLSINEARGKTVHDVYPEALANIHAAHDREVLESGQVVEREVPARWSDGTIHTHLSVKFPVFGADGTVAAIGGINTDITERKRAEETLKDNERKLKDIIDTIPAIVTIKDRESRYIMTNRFHAEYFGGGEEKVTGKTSADVVTPEHGTEMRKREKKVIETGEPLPYFDYELTDRQGVKHDLMVAKSPLKDFSGQIIGTVTAAIDITERKRVEAERDRANRSNQLLKKIAIAANEAASINDAVRFCLKEICAYTGWPVGHAFEVTENGKFNSLRIWQLSEKGTFDEFRKVTESQQWEDGTLCGSVSKTKQPCWIKDLSKVTNFKRGKPLQDLPVKAAFAFPVLVGKDVVATLEFFSEKPEDPDLQLLELMGQVGTQIGRVFEREKALKALDQFKATLDQTQDCVFMFHPKTLKFFYVNQGAVDQVGYSPEELMDMTVIDIKPEFTESSFRKMTNRLKKGKRRAHTFETVHKHKDGTLVPVEIILQYVSLGAQYSRFVAIVRDITDRKRAEEEIVLRHNELLTLHEISEVSLNAQTLHEAYQRIVEIISTNTSFPDVSIELYDKELENRVSVNIEKNSSIRNDAEVGIGNNSIYSGFIVRTGNPSIDRARKVSKKKSDFVSEKPAETTVSAPMVLGNKVIGALTLIHPKKITLDSRLPEWVSILANHLAALTDRIRIEESIKNRDTLYMELSKRLEKIGPSGLHDHELMELVLLLTSRQVNVEDISARILSKLGGFSEALNPDSSALVEVHGGKETAIAFSVIREAATRFTREGISDRPILEDYDKLVAYCRSTMAHDQFEQLRVLYLNRKNKLITDEISHKGTVDKITIYPREIVKRALELGASAVVLVHNHPSDDSTPSHTDIQMTKQLVKALELLEIVVHDHIIVAKSGYSSFKAMGVL